MLTSAHWCCPFQVYEATLAAPLTGKDAEAAAKRFESGTLQLTGDYEPLLPAKLAMLDGVRARVSICEGRYHQIRRMFSAIGHEVLSLHRVSVGGLTMEGLPEGEWRYLTQADIDAVFSGPTAEEVMASKAAAEVRSLPAQTSSSHPRVVSSSSAPTSSVGDEKKHSDVVTRQVDLQSKVDKQQSEVDEHNTTEDEAGMSDGVDDDEEGEAEAALINPTAPVKKMREDARWRKRRLALKTMVRNM